MVFHPCKSIYSSKYLSIYSSVSSFFLAPCLDIHPNFSSKYSSKFPLNLGLEVDQEIFTVATPLASFLACSKPSCTYSCRLSLNYLENYDNDGNKWKMMLATKGATMSEIRDVGPLLHVNIVELHCEL